jgi:hypothetical protein
MVNIPHNCTDAELSEWAEACGDRVKSVRIIRDTVSGASPCFAYVELAGETAIQGAVQALNGRKMRERIVMVSEARGRAAEAHGVSPQTAA